MKWYFLQSWLLWVPAMLLGFALGYLLFRAQWRAVRSTSSSTSAHRSGTPSFAASGNTTPATVAPIRDRAAELENALAAKTSEANAIADERDRHAKELSALQFAHSGVTAAVTERDGQLEKMRAELAVAKSAAADVDAHEARIQSLVGELDAHKARLNVVAADHATAIAAVHAEHDKALADAATAAVAKSDAALTGLRAEHEHALHDVRAERDRTLSGLRADHEKALAELRRRAETAESDLVGCRAEHGRIASDLHTHAARIQGLTGELASTQTELRASTEEVARLKSRVVDDLERVEGIGPAFHRALQSAGIRTFEQLRDTDDATLRKAIQKAGLSFAPSLSTWSRQSAYLAAGDEAGFAQYTEYLIAGQDPEKWTAQEGGDGAFGHGLVSSSDDGSDGPDVRPDDLARIEGIGPKISEALQTAGIKTFQRLSRSSEDRLRAALEAAGMSFAPSLSTWAQQADLLARGDEAGFQALTDALIAGRREGGT